MRCTQVWSPSDCFPQGQVLDFTLSVLFLLLLQKATKSFQLAFQPSPCQSLLSQSYISVFSLPILFPPQPIDPSSCLPQTVWSLSLLSADFSPRSYFSSKPSSF